MLRFPGHHYNRVSVTAAGCLIWGICTLSFSFCSTLTQGYVFWAVNGLGLSLVIPTGQSLIADYHCASARGTAFGAYYLTAAFGSMFGSLYATNIGECSWHSVYTMYARVRVLLLMSAFLVHAVPMGLLKGLQGVTLLGPCSTICTHVLRYNFNKPLLCSHVCNRKCPTPNVQSSHA